MGVLHSRRGRSCCGLGLDRLLIGGGCCRIGSVVVDPALGISMVAVVVVVVEAGVAAEGGSVVDVAEKRNVVVLVLAKLRLVIVVGIGSESMTLRRVLVFRRHSVPVGLLHPSQ